MYDQLRGFDPSGMAFGKVPEFKYEAPSNNDDAILTIKVTRYGTNVGDALPFQLFGALNSIADSQNQQKFPGIIPANSPQYVNALVAYLQGKQNEAVGDAELLATAGGAGAAARAAFIAANTPLQLSLQVGVCATWLPDGSLQIGYANISETEGFSVNGGVVISCEEVPYKTLMENLKTSVLLVRMMRYSYTVEQSLDSSLAFVNASMFGSDKTNNLVPRRYFTPEQQQSKIADIRQAYWLDGELSINSNLRANETEVSFIMNVQKFEKNAIRSGF